MDNTDDIMRQLERLSTQKATLENEREMLKHFIKMASLHRARLTIVNEDIVQTIILIAKVEKLLPKSKDDKPI